MREKPTAEDLLTIARQTLLDDVARTLSGETRYQALMIASAMDIARRQIEAGDAALNDEARALTDLLGSEGALKELNARLAADIRAGAFDSADDRQAAMLKILTDATLAKVRESNPRYLED